MTSKNDKILIFKPNINLTKNIFTSILDGTATKSVLRQAHINRHG